MEKNKKIKYYFKCHCCKIFHRKKYKLCNVSSLKNGVDCSYGTFLSIWKWFVRYAIISPLLSILYWYFRYGLSKYVLSLETFPWGWKNVAAWVITVIFGGGIICLIICGIAITNAAFRSEGGRYFSKERKGYYC